MYKIAVVGDYDSIYGFATLGLEICPAGNREEIRNTLRRLAEEDYGIIYITEAAAAEVESDLEAFQERMLPAAGSRMAQSMINWTSFFIVRWFSLFGICYVRVHCAKSVRPGSLLQTAGYR